MSEKVRPFGSLRQNFSSPFRRCIGKAIVNPPLSVATTKTLWVYGAWGRTAIGNATPTGDNCGHAHASYGVWVKYRYKLPLINHTFWSFAGGGGMSGMRNNAGKCVHKVDNPLKNIDSRFGWGQEALNLNFKGYPIWVEVQEVVWEPWPTPMVGVLVHCPVANSPLAMNPLGLLAIRCPRR
jgi:hypothetical protein